MKNLAGVQNCDEFIKAELESAGLEPIQVERNKGEVPYSLIGMVNNWKVKRAWSYWVVTTITRGLTVERASVLHYKEYPSNNEGYKIYGDSIRVCGHCGCPSPEEFNYSGYVSEYHIDTQEGLNEFVKFIKREAINEFSN